MLMKYFGIAAFGLVAVLAQVHAVAGRGCFAYTYGQTGELMFLLGQESNGLWNDFGGSANAGESALDTAVREFTEETRHVFGKIALRENVLAKPTRTNRAASIAYTLRVFDRTKICNLNRASDGAMVYSSCLIRVPFVSAHELGHAPILKGADMDMKAFTWVNAHDLLNNKSGLRLHERLAGLIRQNKRSIETIFGQSVQPLPASHTGAPRGAPRHANAAPARKVAARLCTGARGSARRPGTATTQQPARTPTRHPAHQPASRHAPMKNVPAAALAKLAPIAKKCATARRCAPVGHPQRGAHDQGPARRQANQPAARRAPMKNVPAAALAKLAPVAKKCVARRCAPVSRCQQRAAVDPRQKQSTPAKRATKGAGERRR